MIIGTIVDGIVIDHIPAGKGMDLYKDLGLDKLECEVAVIKNADSGKYGKKGTFYSYSLSRIGPHKLRYACTGREEPDSNTPCLNMDKAGGSFQKVS